MVGLFDSSPSIISKDSPHLGLTKTYSTSITKSASSLAKLDCLPKLSAFCLYSSGFTLISSFLTMNNLSIVFFVIFNASKTKFLISEYSFKVYFSI